MSSIDKLDAASSDWNSSFQGMSTMEKSGIYVSGVLLIASSSEILRRYSMYGDVLYRYKLCGKEKLVAESEAKSTRKAIEATVSFINILQTNSLSPHQLLILEKAKDAARQAGTVLREN
jgi:hypothetical protein